MCSSPFQAPLNYLDSNWPIRVSKYSWTRFLFCSDGQCIHYYMKEDHRSYGPNICSCEKKVWKISGLYGITVSGLNPVQGCSFFLGSLFATARVASIIAMILFHVILHPAVLIYYFHKFITSVHTLFFQPLYNSQPFTLAALTKLRPFELQNKLYITAF